MSAAKNAAARKRTFPCHQRRIAPRAPTPRAAFQPRRSQCRQSANGGSAGKKQNAASAPRRHSGKCPPSPSSKTASATAAASAAQQSALRPQRPRAYARLPTFVERAGHLPNSFKHMRAVARGSQLPPLRFAAPGKRRQPRVRMRQYTEAPAAAVLSEQRIRPLQPRQRPALSRPVVQPRLQRRRAQPQIGRKRDRLIMRPCHCDPSVFSAAQSVSISMAGERLRSRTRVPSRQTRSLPPSRSFRR